MKRMFLLFSVFVIASLSGEGVTAYREGRNLWVQSRFSPTQDIVIGVWQDANEMAYLIPRNGDIRKLTPQMLLHKNSDEYPATSFAGYGFLSGNHGSAAARLVTAPGHGLTNDECGKTIVDARKNEYVFVKKLNGNQFIMHPKNRAPQASIGRAKFHRHSREKLYFNGKEIKFKSSVLTQVRPLNVVVRNEFLIDGKTPLPEKKVVKCRFIDHVFDHDLLAPEAMVKYIEEKADARTAGFFTHRLKMFYPQDEPAFADYAKLPRIMTVRNRMRYQANGAMVSYRKSHFPVSLAGVSQMDLMFGWSGRIASGKYQMFYIPKTKVQRLTDRRDKNKKYVLDFVKGVDISKGLNVSGSTRAQDALDPRKLPDRFIRVTGKNSPEYGIALGYSLFEGLTADDQAPERRRMSYHHWHTRKMYPYSLGLVNNKPGVTFDTVSYKQYFYPGNDPDATAFYYHKQGKSDVIYFETHKKFAAKKLVLPPSMTGKKITVLEKTPSVILTAGERVTTDGIQIANQGDYGHIVLKLD